jgi:hypothetical protein
MTIPYNYLVVEHGSMALYLDTLHEGELTLFTAFSKGAGFDWEGATFVDYGFIESKETRDFLLSAESCLKTLVQTQKALAEDI